MSKINQICKNECDGYPVRGAGILNAFRFCCKNGLEQIRKNIKEKYNLEES